MKSEFTTGDYSSAQHQLLCRLHIEIENVLAKVSPKDNEESFYLVQLWGGFTELKDCLSDYSKWLQKYKD